MSDVPSESRKGDWDSGSYHDRAYLESVLYHQCAALLAKKLSDLGLGGKSFFCNSGAEANEAMISSASVGP